MTTKLSREEADRIFREVIRAKTLPCHGYDLQIEGLSTDTVIAITFNGKTVREQKEDGREYHDIWLDQLDSHLKSRTGGE